MDIPHENSRLEADYRHEKEFTQEEAKETLVIAKKFRKIVKSKAKE